MDVDVEYHPFIHFINLIYFVILFIVVENHLTTGMLCERMLSNQSLSFEVS